jgi:glycosyltransferase involved in cell wall biosynthesis
MVVLEAMACGTPVIITENTGSKDAVSKGGGFVIPSGDMDALKEKISFLYRNRTVMEDMGRKAHLVAQQYTWENYYRQVQFAVEDIAKKTAAS